MRDVISESAQIISGGCLLAYTLSSAALSAIGAHVVTYTSFSHLMPASAWQIGLLIIGGAQIWSARSRVPVFQIITSYPAMVCCFFFALMELALGAAVNFILAYAVMLGVLNLVSIHRCEKDLSSRG